jgi:hypothetical protein
VNQRRCEAVRKDGSPCRAPALPNEPRCCFHSADPQVIKRRAAGRRQGGLSRSAPARTLPETEPDVPLDSARDVVRLLAGTINSVRKGQIDPRSGNCIGQLAGALLKALQDGAVEERLAAIEQRLDALVQAARQPFLSTNLKVEALPCRRSNEG